MASCSQNHEPKRRSIHGFGQLTLPQTGSQFVSMEPLFRRSLQGSNMKSNASVVTYAVSLTGIFLTMLFLSVHFDFYFMYNIDIYKYIFMYLRREAFDHNAPSAKSFRDRARLLLQDPERSMAEKYWSVGVLALSILASVLRGPSISGDGVSCVCCFFFLFWRIF